MQPTAASVAFTNTYASGETPTPPAPGKETGSLPVSKTIAGDAGDKTAAFPFTATLSDASINGTFGGMTFIDGVATFELAHGETVTATGCLRAFATPIGIPCNRRGDFLVARGKRLMKRGWCICRCSRFLAMRAVRGADCL